MSFKWLAWHSNNTLYSSNELEFFLIFENFIVETGHKKLLSWREVIWSKWRIFKLRIQNKLKHILFPHIKKKSDMCVCVAHAANQDSSMIRVHWIACRIACLALHIQRQRHRLWKVRPSFLRLIQQSHVQRFIPVFKDLQNRLANHPLNPYLCSLASILPNNRFLPPSHYTTSTVANNDTG